MPARRFSRSARAANKPSYGQTFLSAENPLSGGGAWSQPSATNTIVSVSGGVAFGTQTGTDGFNDSIALLSGFPANQSANAAVFRDPAFSFGGTAEVEILLRASAPGGVATWYEFTFAYNGNYAQLVYIHDGTFSYLVGNGSGTVGGGDNGGPAGGIQDGDLIECSAVGNVFSGKVNGAAYISFTDTGGPGGASRISQGSPGMGFWRGGGAATGNAAPNKFCFRAFNAVSL